MTALTCWLFGEKDWWKRQNKVKDT